MNNKKCCGTCANGTPVRKQYRQTINRVKRIECGIDIPDVEFPPMPVWAWYELESVANDDLLPSDGKNCPCWREK